MLRLDAHRVPDPLLLSWSPRAFQLDFLECPLAIRTLTSFHIRFPKGLWGLATNPPILPITSWSQVISVTGHHHPALPLPMLLLLSLAFLCPPSGPSLGAPLQRLGSPRPPLPSLYRTESGLLLDSTPP